MLAVGTVKSGSLKYIHFGYGKKNQRGKEGGESGRGEREKAR